MNEPLRITIQTHGARAHQSGNGPGREGQAGGSRYRGIPDEVYPHGPVEVHVRDGKPVTALGRKLLGWPPSKDHVRPIDSARPGGVL